MAHEKIVSIHWKNVSKPSIADISLRVRLFANTLVLYADHRTMHQELKESSWTHQKRLQNGERRDASQCSRMD